MLLSLRRKSEEQKRKEREKRNRKGNEEERELKKFCETGMERNNCLITTQDACLRNRTKHAEAPQGAQA